MINMSDAFSLISRNPRVASASEAANRVARANEPLAVPSGTTSPLLPGELLDTIRAFRQQRNKR